MIEYVEARNEDFEVIGIIDTAQSVIWHSVYYGVGDFEIYINLNDGLKIIGDARYITRTDNEEVGIIETIFIADNVDNGKMMTIKGRFAKSLLDRRIIYNMTGNSNKATIMQGEVVANIRLLVSRNAITQRSLDVIELGDNDDITKKIVDENGNLTQKQVSFDNLLEFTDSFLKEYGLASTLKLNGNKLQFFIYEGEDRSAYIVFGREFDNLLSSEYKHDSTQEKNVAIIGGEGEGIDRFCTILGSQSGINRKEVFVDASSIGKKYKENDVEYTYSDAIYERLLKAHASQVTSAMTAHEDFNGTIDITNGNWKFGIDFFLGDIVTLQDNDIGVYKAVRIGEVTEYQDQDGYAVEAVYQGE